MTSDQNTSDKRMLRLTSALELMNIQKTLGIAALVEGQTLAEVVGFGRSTTLPVLTIWEDRKTVL